MSDDTTRPAQPRPDWFDERNCRDVDTRLFFPMQGENHLSAAAKAVCAGCTVREQCLQFALDNEERFGIWGGTSEKQRRRMRRDRRVAAGVAVRPVNPTHGVTATYNGGCRCEPCRLAYRVHQRERRRNGPPPPPASAPCGTNAAYVSHYRRGEKPCDDCIAARAIYVAQRKGAA